jgi:succinyl-diaminopimelate desuccinylase
VSDADPDALAARTLELVDISSESRHEGEILGHVRGLMSNSGPPLALDTGSAVLYATGRPAVVLAGHVDTVPAQGNLPGRLADGAVLGLGASDMKGGLAVMLELARARVGGFGYLFFAREELPVSESALPEILAAAGAVRQAELVIMLEPTDCALELGCLGNLNAELRFVGAAAHSARPWLGDNAIHRAIRELARLAAVEPRRVRQGEVEYVEVLSLTGIRGGVARNVVPPEAVADVNYRYAPDRTPGDAEARLRELAGEVAEVTVVGNAPPAPVPARNPHVERLRAAGAGPVRGKQAWTPVAEFAQAGLEALNFGPGDPAQAHAAGEHVRVEALARAYRILAEAGR